MERFGGVPEASSSSCRRRAVGEALVDDPRVPLVSATGSTAHGPRVGRVAGSASAAPSSSSAATTPRSSRRRRPRARRARHPVRRGGHRRPALHHAAPPVRARAASTTRSCRACQAYAQVRIGDPLADGTLVGPLIDGAPFDAMQRRARRGRARGRQVTGGDASPSARPAASTSSRAGRDAAPDARSCEETFAPILYVIEVRRPRRGDRAAQRRAAGPVVVDLHRDLREAGAVPVGARLRLRHRQRQHRHVGRRDRRRVRRREGDRRRPRVRLGRVEGLHAPRRPTRSTTARRCRWRRASARRSRNSITAPPFGRSPNGRQEGGRSRALPGDRLPRLLRGDLGPPARS